MLFGQVFKDNFIGKSYLEATCSTSAKETVLCRWHYCKTTSLS